MSISLFFWDKRLGMQLPDCMDVRWLVFILFYFFLKKQLKCFLELAVPFYITTSNVSVIDPVSSHLH